MNARAERLRHLYGWDSSYTTMTTTPSNYKYPDGIVLTLKTSNHSDHYFVERTFALQLVNSIRESLTTKKGKVHPKHVEAKPAKVQKKVVNKAKPKPD